jgi:hypothetical protein
MIASFPSFSLIKLEDKHAVEQITAQFEPYSDFNFTSLYSWGREAEISLLRDNLIIRLPDYLTGKLAISVLGTTDLESSLEDMFKVTPTLKLVPEVVVRNLAGPHRYRLSEDVDNHDYIFDVAALAKMPGGNYKKKRNKVSRVEAYFGSRLKTQVARLPNLQMLDVIFTDWAAEEGRSSEDIKAEYDAFCRLLQASSSFNLHTTVVLIDGQPKAFSINEILSNHYAICHFEKTLNTEDQDLATYLVRETAIRLLDMGVTRVNWEQDLGMPGLRQSKASYQPIDYLRKYSITKLST